MAPTNNSVIHRKIRVGVLGGRGRGVEEGGAEEAEGRGGLHHVLLGHLPFFAAEEHFFADAERFEIDLLGQRHDPAGAAV